MDVVIVGAGAAGLKCATRLRRRSAEVKITVVDEGNRISFGRCGLPYFVSGQITTSKNLEKRLMAPLEMKIILERSLRLKFSLKRKLWT